MKKHFSKFIPAIIYFLIFVVSISFAAVSRVKTWSDGEVLTHTDLNAEFQNIIDNMTTAISPLTANLDFAGYQGVNFVLEKLGADGSGVEGQLIYNTTSNVPKIYTTAWKQIAFGDSRIKGWCNLDGTGTMTVDDHYNVDTGSCVDNGAGDYTIAWDTDFATTDYVIVGTSTTAVVQISSSLATGSARMKSTDIAGTPTDADPVCIIAIGAQ